MQVQLAQDEAKQLRNQQLIKQVGLYLIIAMGIIVISIIAIKKSKK